MAVLLRSVDSELVYSMPSMRHIGVEVAARDSRIPILLSILMLICMH